MIYHVMAEADNLRIEHGLFAPENLLSLAVHIDDVAKQAIPIRMLFEGFGYPSQNTRAKTIVGVHNDDDVARSHARALVHGVVMAFVFFGNEDDLRIAADDIECFVL